jgi:hypothetical protein
MILSETATPVVEHQLFESFVRAIVIWGIFGITSGDVA